jgi:hypothetical protein
VRTTLAAIALVAVMSTHVPQYQPAETHVPQYQPADLTEPYYPPPPEPIALAVTEPVPVVPHEVTEPVPVVPYEVYGAIVRYARPEDVSQWLTILRCETAGFDNSAVGEYGEVSIAQILPSTLAGVGLTVADVQTRDSAVYAAVRVSEQAYKERGDRFWPWSTRYGCGR